MKRITQACFAILSLALLAAGAPKRESLPKETAVDLGNGIKLEMVLIPAGEFMMGAPASDRDAELCERPQHRVRITEPFYLGKYPVTQEQWEALMESNPSTYKNPKNPVTGIEWKDCHMFLKRLNKQVGGEEFRLPSEAQREYACRAGTTTRYFFGDEPGRLGEYALVDLQSQHPSPIGTKKPNPWGLYDMIGNVSEICQDVAQPNYYAHSPTDDPVATLAPLLASSPHSYIVRGAPWKGVDEFCRSSCRYGWGSEETGVRVARVAPGTTGHRTMAMLPLPPPKPPLEPRRLAQSPKTPLKQTAIDLGGGVKLEMILIPAGRFVMGAPETEQKGIWPDGPQHRVRITKPFWLGKYPVTQEVWEAVMGSNPSKFKGLTSPVEMVSWNDSQRFLAKLNAKIGGEEFLLPTEAQWEYACRAGGNTAYCFGDDPAKLKDYAWYVDNSDNRTHPVGEKKPNAWGLYDMHGNVCEACADYFDYRRNEWGPPSPEDNYYLRSPIDNPQGPEHGQGGYHVYRGGGTVGTQQNCRSASRFGSFRANCGAGLRIARAVSEKDAAVR